MTLTFDPNRVHWEAVARDEVTDWAGLATEPVGVEGKPVADPAGVWLQPGAGAAGLLLMSAWTDLAATGDSYDSGSDPFFTRELVQALGAGYLAGADPHGPYAAPAHADLHALPATYLQVGAEEALLDDRLTP